MLKTPEKEIEEQIWENPNLPLIRVVEYFGYEAESDCEYDLLQSQSESDNEKEQDQKIPNSKQSEENK